MANARVRGRPIAQLVLSAQERAYLERQVVCCGMLPPGPSATSGDVRFFRAVGG